MELVYIEGFDERYTISSDGVVYTEPDHIPKRLFRREGSNTVMVELTLNGKKYTRSVAKLVFQHFGESEFDELRQIIHIDGDPENNDISNLRQVLPRNKRILLRRPWPAGTRIRVVETGEIFRSALYAANALGANKSAIYACANGERETHMGLHFEWHQKPNIVYNDRKFD